MTFYVVYISVDKVTQSLDLRLYSMYYVYSLTRRFLCDIYLKCANKYSDLWLPIQTIATMFKVKPFFKVWCDAYIVTDELTKN